MTALPKGITRRGDKYRVSIMVNGARRTATADTLEAAQTLASRIRAGDILPGSRIGCWSLSEAYENYINQNLIPQGRADRTIMSVRSRAQLVLRILGADMRLDDFDTVVAYRYAETVRRENLIGLSTLSLDLTILGSVLRHARKMGGMTAAMPEFPKIKAPRTTTRYLTKEEEKTLLETLSVLEEELVSDAVTCLLDTGMRVGCELLPIKWRDVSLDQKKLHIWHGKSREPRTVPMTGRVHGILSRLKAVRGTLGGPFEGLSYDTFRASFDKARVLLNRKGDEGYTPHILRHTFCTRLASNGVDLRTVQYLAGHQSIQTTMRYAHFVPERMASAINTLDDDGLDRPLLRVVS